MPSSRTTILAVTTDGGPATQAWSPVDIGVTADLRSRIAELAAGRPIVIDHFASRRCGATIGDLRVRFGADIGRTSIVELEPIEDVPVHVEADLIGVLAGGAELRRAGPPFAPHLAISLRRPELWLDFLESHPRSRS